MSLITVLICTHNRAELLGRVLDSLNRAKQPVGGARILVVANACTDGTQELLEAYRSSQSDGRLALDWVAEPKPGKSHALNRALGELTTELTAMVDDDHRVDANYLVEIERATLAWPEAGLYCGRILPDWDGTEPEWVHDEGPFRIYPLPVPRYEQGSEPKAVTLEEGTIPGGGNLVVRRAVFALAGQFSTELGPHRHDLGGGEDTEYVIRAMTRGARLQYVPAILQYHYVDLERLKLSYIIRKGYQRTRSTARINHVTGRVPAYMWRKLAEYGWHSVFSLLWTKRRFYLVRCAAALGEMRGMSESGNRRRLPLPPDPGTIAVAGFGLLSLTGGLLAWFALGANRWAGLMPAGAVALLGSMGLLGKSLLDFSQTGPRIRDEILNEYKRYSLWALLRLGAWAFALLLVMGLAGVALYGALGVWRGWAYSPWFGLLAAVVGVALITLIQFLRKLLFNPGLLIASMHYRASRLYPVWAQLTPQRVRLVLSLLGAAIALITIGAASKLTHSHEATDLIALSGGALFYGGLLAWSSWSAEARAPSHSTPSVRPNILLIGSDTLRADRVGSAQKLTPRIDELAARGAHFTHCYVPCARTAPSLISMLTGTWPHTHGVRDNFVADSNTRLPVSTLPQWLSALGYRNAAISDWCGGDMAKFDFGFDHLDLPEDQWNLKYLIRQGPKDLRLFLSLFTHNRLGRFMLPELYYLGGVPLTTDLGRRARRLISRMASSHQPFFINVFYSTTHPPFASEFPWYTRYADPTYVGESKFAMARLTDPFDIIRRQGEPREEFDLDQILHLYDGCVAQFDHEVGLILDHLEKSGLADNTIVVVYSDHGMEFFEHETWGQGNSAVGDVSPRIPLIIADPRREDGSVISQVTRSIDIAPTLIDLVGGEIPQGLDGASLMPLMDHPEKSLSLPAFNETGMWITEIPGLPDTHLRYPNLLQMMEVPNVETGTLAIKDRYLDIILRAKDRMVREGRWKLVYQPLDEGHRLMLFDVVDDPACTRDLSAQHREITEALWASLKAWMAKDLLYAS